MLFLVVKHTEHRNSSTRVSTSQAVFKMFDIVVTTPFPTPQSKKNNIKLTY